MNLKPFIASLSMISLLSNATASGFDNYQRKGVITAKESQYRFKYPKDVITVDKDDSYVYMASKKDIRFMAKEDIDYAASKNEDLALVPFWKVSLANELKGKDIVDMAVQRTTESHVFHVTTSQGDNSFELKSFAIREAVKQNADLEKSKSENKKINTHNNLGLFAIKGGATDIIGNGEVAVVREPHNGNSLLISLDKHNELLHVYSLANPLLPEYKESFQISLKGLENVKLENTSKSGTTLSILSKTTSQKISIYDLRAKARISRTNSLINLENEINGNSWIKNFLFLGLFSNAVDYLDKQFGNPNITTSELEKDPVLNKLASSVTDDEVFEYLKVNKLLTDDEIANYRLNLNLNTASGTKWFFSVAVIVGTIKLLHIKAKASSYGAAIKQYKNSIYKISARIVKPNTYIGKYVYKIGDKLSAVQLKLRARLIKNFYNMEYPAHAINSLRKLLYKAKIINKDQFKTLKKLPFKEQYEALLKVALDNSSSIKSLKGQKLGKQLEESLEMTDTFVKNVQANKQFRNLKVQVLTLLKKYHPEYKSISLQSSDMTAYILATDMPTILAKVKELDNVLNKASKLKGSKYLDLAELLKSKSKEIEDLGAKIAGYGTEGRVAKHWDKWASFTQKYSHFFLPEKAFQGNNKLSKFLNEHTRQDAVKVGPGHVQHIKISGEHAKSAFWLGISDTLGEIVSQTVARRTLADPNEWSIGSGDNHLELFTYNEKEYGVHFDLIIHTFGNLIGWWMGMPLSLAASGLSFGAKGKITLTNRVMNSVKKGFNPINYAYGQLTLNLPILKLTSWALEMDYLQDHKDDLDEEAYNTYMARLNGRLTSFSSFAERKMLGVVVDVPSVHPQFFIQAEFDKVARSLFNSSVPGTMVSALVMPLTSGFFSNRARGIYFGTNNPNMFEMLKKFGAQGILNKIDENGITDINKWSELEKSSFMNIIISLEMAKESKTNPLSRSASIEDQSKWFMKIGENLFGKDYTNRDLSDISPLIKVTTLSNEKFRYEDEVIELNTQLDNLKKRIAILPYIKEPNSDNSFVVMSKLKNKVVTNGFNELSEVSNIQAKLIEALDIMSSNHSTLSKQQRTSVSIAIYDSLYLMNAFLLNNKMIEKSFSLFTPLVNKLERLSYKVSSGKINLSNIKKNRAFMSKASQKLQRPLNSVLNSNLLLFGSIPLYLWIDNQIESHIKIEEYISTLVSDLQDILFSMTKVIVSESLKDSSGQYSQVSDLSEYLSLLEKKEEYINKIVFNSQEESEKYLDSRIYRMPSILADFGPIGMGMSGGWMLSHYLLFKNSKGFVSKMADKFAPGLLKYSFILWFGMSQVDNIIQKNIYLTTVDFLNLHTAYYTTLLEIELVKELLKNKELGNKQENIQISAIENLENNKMLLKLNLFRERLQELSIIGNKAQQEESD